MTTNFLFSSVGNNTNFDSLWINDKIEYDIYVIYYGDDEDIFNKYRSKVKLIEKRKGSKFQNFKYFYDTYIDIINKYDRFFILDDDIIFNVEDINNMFKLSKKYNLDICAPSFLSEGKISHSVTEHKKDIILTYTNFVEVNTPLFNVLSLHKLMNTIDYTLMEWGVDFLYIWCNGIYKQKSYAIIHCITCINPHDLIKINKNNKREFHLIENGHKKKEVWKSFSIKIGCPSRFKLIEYDSIYKINPALNIETNNEYDSIKPIDYQPIINLTTLKFNDNHIFKNYLLTNNIEQIYVSSYLINFQDYLYKNFNLKSYNDISKPCIFFGTYSDIDIDIIKYHISCKYIMFTGTDLNNFKNLKINNYTKFISISKDIQDSLNNNNIKNDYLNLIDSYLVNYSNDIYPTLSPIPYKESINDFIKDKIDKYMNGIDIIYWINLEYSVDRYNNMMKILELFPVQNIRINAIDGKNINIYNRFSANVFDKTNSEYACLLSHLITIKQFSESEYDTCLILEDDVNLEFVKYWNASIKDIISKAPKDWEILMLTYITDTPLKSDYTYNNNNVYIFSTAAYILNKKAAIKFIKEIYIDNKFTLGSDKIHTADEFLFDTFITYTYKYAYFIYENNNDSTIHTNHYEYHKKSKNIIIETWKKFYNLN